MKVSAVDSMQQVSLKQIIDNSGPNQKNLNDNKQTVTESGKDMRVNEEQVIKAIEKANKSLAMAQTRFEFSIHEKTKEIMVKVFDKQTGELIREIPPEKILDMVAYMWELAGIIVDERV